MKFASRLVSFDVAPGDPFRPMATPIYQTATFEQEEATAFGPYDYSRSGNPTRTVLEEQLAALENGTRGFCFSSGMAAISTITRLLRTGDEIVADSDLYGGTCRLFTRVLDRTGITARYADACDVEAFAAQITERTRLVYLESPTNPLLRVVDIRHIADLAHANGALLAVDSSAMSPYLQTPLDLGADIVLHSATKYLCGHSDVTAGVVVVKDDETGEADLLPAKRGRQCARSVRCVPVSARAEDPEVATGLPAKERAGHCGVAGGASASNSGQLSRAHDFSGIPITAQAGSRCGGSAELHHGIAGIVAQDRGGGADV